MYLDTNATFFFNQLDVLGLKKQIRVKLAQDVILTSVTY